MSEVGLGQSGDPRALVGGDPGAICECAATLRRFADHLGEAADGLERIDLRQWQGEAAETFRARFGESPRAWRDAATAFGQASTAMERFGTTVAWAQGQAAEAIDAYARAVAASEAARADYNARVDAHRAATGAGAVPPPMEPFVDPATADLAGAQETLAAARRERDTAATRTVGEMRAAAELTAPPPSTVAQLGGDVADGLGVLGTVNDRLQAGAVRGVEGLVQFGRTVSPIDYYNLSHPAEYLTNVSGTTAGLVSATAHPTELIKGMVGTGWGSDPAGAAGALIPNLALDAATGGGGVAGQLGRGLLGKRPHVETVDAPHSPITPGGGLQAHENAGGHTLAPGKAHVGATDEQLLERLGNDARRPSATSTFADRATAERSVSENLAAHREAIAQWLADGNAPAARFRPSTPWPDRSVRSPRRHRRIAGTGRVRLACRPPKGPFDARGLPGPDELSATVRGPDVDVVATRS